MRLSNKKNTSASYFEGLMLTDVTPLLMHWNHVSFVLSHWHGVIWPCCIRITIHTYSYLVWFFILVSQPPLAHPFIMAWTTDQYAGSSPDFRQNLPSITVMELGHIYRAFRTHSPADREGRQQHRFLYVYIIYIVCVLYITYYILNRLHPVCTILSGLSYNGDNFWNKTHAHKNVSLAGRIDKLIAGND